MRVFVPSTMTLLAAAVAAGQVVVDVAHAVTPTLREWYPQGDAEELEYVASSAAAESSLRLLADDGAHDADTGSPSTYRRVVLAVEVPDAAVRPAAGAGRSVVQLTAPVPWKAVASALVDDAAAADDVRRGVDALRSSSGDALRDALEVAADHELGWYAVQELAGLVRP